MSRLEGFHRGALVALALTLGLFEGPAEIACVVVVATTLLTRRLRKAHLLHPVFLGALLWTLAGIPGVLTVDAHVSSQGYLRPLHALAILAGGFGLRGVPSVVLHRMAWAFGLAIVANGAYGLLQVMWGELPLDAVLLAKRSSPQIFVPGSRTIRCASGLFYNRIRLAHIGSIGLSLLLVVATAHVTRGLRLLATAGLGLLGFAILLTYARMVVVVWGVTCIAVLVLLARRRAALFAVAGNGLLGAALFATQAGQQRIGKLQEDLEIRGRIFEMARTIFAESPWFGCGHGVYSILARPMIQPGWSRNWSVDAHNLYLHALAETGVIGFLGFFTCLVMGLWTLARRVRSEAHGSTTQAHMRRFTLLVLLTFTLLGLMHQPLHHSAVGLMFWFSLGLGAFEASLDACGPLPRGAGR